MNNQKNLFLAVLLSIIVLVGFDFFFVPKTSHLDQPTTKNVTELHSSEVDEPSVTGIKTTKKDLEIDEKRISFNMDRVAGSLNLFGSTLDDLILKDYFEKVNKQGENIKILKKENSETPYFLRIGWASPDKSLIVPDKNSLWNSDKKKYGSNNQIILKWNNKKGLFFVRKISFDQNFMISVEDSVINKSSKSVELTNFSYIQRKNYRPENKFFILHEGPLGVFNDTLKEISYEDIEESGEIVELSSDGWIGFTDHYWQVAIFPDKSQPFKARFKKIKDSSNSIQIDYIQEKINLLAPNKTLTSKSFIFAGAKEVPLIDSYIESLGVNKFDLSVDFGWFYFLTKPLFYALHFLSSLVGNFGIGIVILTICVRILNSFHPIKI